MTFVAGTVLTAAALNSELAAKSDTAPAINAQTGTTYTFVLADATAGKTITASNASASIYTVPPQSSVAFSAGALLRVTNLGAGVVTFAGGVGVTVSNTAGTLAQYQTATLVRTASDAWTVIPAGNASGLTLVATATASASSTVSINNCFTALYDCYRVIIDITAQTGAVNMKMRLRVGGVDATTNYNQAGMYGGSVSGNENSSGSAFQLNAGPGSHTAHTIMDLIDPAQARRTGATYFAYDTRPLFLAVGGQHTTSTAYDGFSIYPDSGTFTTPTNGIRVYGYKNS